MRTGVFSKLCLFLGVALAIASAPVWAAEVPPITSFFYFQTNAPDGQMGFGDWYSDDEKGPRGYHYVSIYVPCNWPDNLPIQVDLFSPDLTTAWINDEVAGNPDQTEFQLFYPGTFTFMSPATPGPAPNTPTTPLTRYNGGSLAPAWVRFQTINIVDAQTECGEHLLRVETLDSAVPPNDGGDQNSYNLRVGWDNDADPNNAPPATTDNPDNLPGTDDEISIGLKQITFEQRGGTCEDLYQFVQPTQAQATFNNFDIDDNDPVGNPDEGDLRLVTYYAPSETIDMTGMTGGVEGETSGNNVWNLGTSFVRGGDVINNPETGWWGIVTCVSDNNQFIQEGQTGVPAFFEIPPTPVIEISKVDDVASADVGDTVTYTIELTNTSDTTATPGAATQVVLTDPIPTDTTYVGGSCTIGAPFEGTCGEAAGLLTFDLDVIRLDGSSQVILPGETAVLTFAVTIDSGATFPIVNTATVNYRDTTRANNFVDTATEQTFQGAGVQLTKTPSTGAAAIGDPVTYTYTTLNNSLQPVQINTLTDDRIGPITVPAARPIPDAVYGFDLDGSPDTIEDLSGLVPALDLTVEDPAEVTYQVSPNLLNIPGPGTTRLSNTSATRLSTQCGAADALAVEMWIESGDAIQTGTIAMIGTDLANFNLRLRQVGTRYEINLDTAGGTEVLQTPVNTVTPDLVHLVAVLTNASQLELWHQPISAGTPPLAPLVTQGSNGDLSSWDVNADLALANDLGADNGWKGEFYKAAIYCDELQTTEIQENYSFGSETLLNGQPVLLPGESLILNAVDTVDLADFPGPVINIATVAGFGPEGIVVGDMDSATVIISPVTLNLTKTPAPLGVVAPPQVITYTLVLTNTDNMNGNTQVTVQDQLPAGLSYVPNSTVATGPQATIRNYRDEFPTRNYNLNAGTDLWATSWVETNDDGSPTAGNLQVIGGASDNVAFKPETTASNPPTAAQYDCLDRFADPGIPNGSASLVTLDFDYIVNSNVEDCVTNGNANARDCVLVQSQNDGATWVDKILYEVEDDLGQNGATGSIQLDFTAEYNTGTTTQFGVRFCAAGFRGGSAQDFGTGTENIHLDNIELNAQSLAIQTLDNIPAGVNADLIDGVPSNLVDPNDGFILQAQGSMVGGQPSDQVTVTFQATVLNDPSVINIYNVASADTLEANPVAASSVNPLTAVGIIGDRVWLDADRDGLYDVGEPGLSNVELQLVDLNTAMVVATTRTGINGSYSFLRLMAGNYAVQLNPATLPPGLQATINTVNPTAPIPLAPGQEYRLADFGYVGTDPALAIIGDRLFSDANGNGIQDPGEPGIAGVTIELRGAGSDGIFGNGDDTLDMTTSGADGSYWFTNVVPGDYDVVVTDTAMVLTGYTSTNGTTSPPITVAPGETFAEADFGFQNNALGSITDQVWFDLDGDGVFDASEVGLPQVRFNLLDAGGNVIATTASDSSGQFSFDGLPDGVYTIQVADRDFSIGNVAATTQASIDLQLPGIVIAGGADVAGINFGLNKPGSLGDTVYLDANANGTRDPGEMGIPGVTLTRFRDDGDGVFEPSTGDNPEVNINADGSGLYLFESLAFAPYWVSIDPAVGSNAALLAGLTTTTLDDSGLAGEQRLAVINSGTGGLLTIDFGYERPNLQPVSGRIFQDDNRNGRDDMEGAFVGVGVELVDSITGLVMARTTTNANGDYVFPDVLDGSYLVRVDDTAGVLANTTLTSGLDEISIDVMGAGVPDIDFGYALGGNTGSIGDFVWLDANGDGIAQGGEPGVGGVVIDLYDAGPDGMIGGGDDVLVASVETDALGGYDFPGLPPGSYYADVDQTTLPSGTEFTVGSSDPSGIIRISLGEDFNDLDIGVRAVAGTVILGDRIFIDGINIGVEDPGEGGIAGVSVSLISGGPNGILGDGDDLAPVTVMTDAMGFYRFTGVLPSRYILSVDTGTLPAGYDTSPTNTLGNTSYVFDTVATAGQSYLLLDWGFQRLPGQEFGTISDTVFFDADSDGVFDAAEQGLENVSLNLISAGGDGMFGTPDDVVEGTVLTADDGSFTFAGLGDGDYQLAVTDNGGVLNGLSPTTALPGTLTIAGGNNLVGTGIGYGTISPTGTIGNLVFHDANNSGIRELNESGIQGVRVELWLDVNANQVIDPGVDNFLRDVDTDINGGYEFSGVAEGNYLVFVPTDNQNGGAILEGLGLTAGAADIDDNSQSNPYPIIIDLSFAKVTGTAVALADFGFNAAMSFVVNGTVFEDIDNNALLGGLEPGVPGPVVFIYRDLNDNGILDPGDPVFGKTTADANGDFQFTNLPLDNFIVQVDATGSRVESYFQTTQGATGGVQPVTPLQPQADFGFYNGGITTTPITLAGFKSRVDGKDTLLTWSTTTESGNIGFRIMVGSAHDGLKTLVSMVPSKVVSSTRWQTYQHRLNGRQAGPFWITDIDYTGFETLHGPFDLGREYGRTQAPELLDWQQVRADLAKRASPPVTMKSGTVTAMDMVVEKDNLYRVSYQALADAGLDLSGVPAIDIAVTVAGEPVAIRVMAAGYEFGPGDYIEFHGQKLGSLYSDARAYRLQVDGANALRVATSSSAGQGLDDQPLERYRATLDDNRRYSFGSPNGDPWFLTDIFAGTNPVELACVLRTETVMDGHACALDLPGFIGGPTQLSLSAWGVTDFLQFDPDHHLQVEVNGQTVVDEFSEGLSVLDYTVNLANGLLDPVSTDVLIRLPGDSGAPFDLVSIESLAVSYLREPQVIDDQFLGEMKIQGGDSTPFDPDVISRSGFESLADQSFDLDGFQSPEVVAYAQVDGSWIWLESASASPILQGFVARVPGGVPADRYSVHGTGSMAQPQLVAVMDNVDLTSGPADYVIISHAAFLGPELQLLADRHRSNGLDVKVVDVADIYSRFGHGMIDPEAIRRYIGDMLGRHGTRFVLLVGGDSYDYRDELGLGSISFIPSIYGQVHEVVRYAPVDALIADTDGDQVPDVAIGRFPVRTPQELAYMVDKTLAYMDKDYSATAVFAADRSTPLEPFAAVSQAAISRNIPNWDVTTAFLDDSDPATVTGIVVDAINTGTALTNYFGHSGFTEWGLQTTGRLFTVGDALGLTNLGRPTVINQWGCWNTYYVDPQSPTLGQQFLTAGDFGAAAVLGPVSLARMSSEHLLGNATVPLMLVPGATLGEAILEGKQQLAAEHPDRNDVIWGYTLLGDPALVIDP